MIEALIIVAACIIIPALVSLIELMSRYSRGTNLSQLLSDKLVLLYMSVNSIAGLVAFSVSTNFIFTSPSNLVDHLLLVISSSVGGLAVLRSSVADVSQNNSRSISVGPGFILDLLLSQLDLRIDQNRAARSLVEVKTLVSNLSYEKCKGDLPILCRFMMERLSTDEEDEIMNQMQAIDESLESSDVKMISLAILLRQYVGLDALKEAIDSLGREFSKDDDVEPNRNSSFQNQVDELRKKLGYKE